MLPPLLLPVAAMVVVVVVVLVVLMVLMVLVVLVLVVAVMAGATKLGLRLRRQRKFESFKLSCSRCVRARVCVCVRVCACARVESGGWTERDGEAGRVRRVVYHTAIALSYIHEPLVLIPTLV